MTLIESDIELRGFEGEDNFNIYLCEETLNIWAKGKIKGKSCEIQFRVKEFYGGEFKDDSKNNKATIERLKVDYRYEYLTSRLGRYTKDDEVSIGDIFMYGHYEKIGHIVYR